MEPESIGSGDGVRENAAAAPKGARFRREDDGTLILDLPVSRDRFMRVFLCLFGLPFIGAGLILLLGKGEAVGLFLLGTGLLTGWFGLYLAIGRLEIRLGAERVDWTRIFLRRWRTRFLERGRIASLATRVGVRTNGRPTSWCLSFVLAAPEIAPVPKRPERQALPGYFEEGPIVWLGNILATWAQAPFDPVLDRSVSRGD